MNFNELIRQNELADKKMAKRMEDDKENLFRKVGELASSLDVDMLRAIGLYGEKCNFGGSRAGMFKIDNLRIIVEMRDGIINKWIVLYGGHGFVCMGTYYELIVAGTTNNDNYVSNRVSSMVWTESNMCPDLTKIKASFPDTSVYQIATHRGVGDGRTWFTYVNEAMPKFVETFKEYLINRIDTTK